MKVIVAHAGQQHSYQTAAAFCKNDSLLKYITTVYYKPWSLTWFISPFLPKDQKKRCKNRTTTMLPNSKILQISELRGLMILALRRSERLMKLFPNYIRNLTDDFGVAVAKYAIKHNADVVIMYDTNSNTCFRYLKEHAPKIKRVLDVSIANRLYLKDVYTTEIKRFPQYAESIYKEQRDILEDLQHHRRQEEIDNSQFFLAGSNFVKKSLLYSGAKEDSVYVINYGVDKELFSFNTPQLSHSPLKVLFVGQINFRKGLHHLLKIVSSYDKGQVVLNVVGGFSVDNELYNEYKGCNNINFMGFVTRDRISEIFNAADVFVLPSLAEGFALVTLEALSSGCPVICSTNSGCNDVIVDGHNGFVIDVSDEQQLKQKIDWFLDNMDKIPMMKKNARTTVDNHGWNNYQRILYDAISSIENKQ